MNTIMNKRLYKCLSEYSQVVDYSKVLIQTFPTRQRFDLGVIFLFYRDDAKTSPKYVDMLFI